MKLRLLALCLVLPSLAQAALTAAFAERDITPEIGMEVPGGYGKAFSKRIHDPCKVRVAVFDDGKQRVALVGLDALGVPRALVLEARAEIERNCGLPGAAVMIGASHSHSSGPLGMVQPGDFDHASELVKDLAYKKSSMADAGYMAKGARRDRRRRGRGRCAARAGDHRLRRGQRADGRLQPPAQHEERHAAFASRQGQSGQSSVTPGRPIRRSASSASGIPTGKLIGCVVNFSCHATANGPWITANWIYYMERVIQGYYGAEAKVVFLQGACGDVTQVDNSTRRESRGRCVVAIRRRARRRGGGEGAGRHVADAGGRGPVAVRQKVLKIPRRLPSPERVEAARALIAAGPEETRIGSGPRRRCCSTR